MNEKMVKEIELDQDVYENLEQLANKQGLTPSEMMVKIIKDRTSHRVSVDFAHKEFVDEITKVAKDHYQGGRDQFIRFAVRQQIENIKKKGELLTA